MSSFTRRGCFKCGNVGHIAEACESQTRLCYNCRSPEHESNQCPHPRTTEAKQCYSCAGVGHVASSCPSAVPALGGGGFRGPGVGGPKCYNCGFPGHIARLCPNPPGMGVTGIAPGGFRGVFPPARRAFLPGVSMNTKCYRCNGAGHIAANCPSVGLPPAGPPRPKTCYKCQIEGHIARDCPENAVAASVAESTSTSPAKVEQPLIPAAAEVH